MTTFPVIYADPPWNFKTRSMRGRGRNADRHYMVQSDQWIHNLPVQRVAADDCALFLWTTMPHLKIAFDVINAWGFTYKTCAFTWVKTNKRSHSFFMGMGYWTRSNAELCLLATRGNPRRKGRNVRQVIQTLNRRVLMTPVRRHSEKPPEVHTAIETLVDTSGPYLELFARKPCPGWVCLGNEIDGQDIYAAMEQL